MLKFAIRNLCSRPTRSLLSLLGLTVAIVGMVGLFSVARGLDRLVSSTFDRIHGLIAMQPGAPIPLFSRLPKTWGDEIAEMPGIACVSPEVWARVNVINEKMILSPPRFLFGTDIASRLKLKQGVYRDDIVAGRFLTLEDRGKPHCVVSRQIAEEFRKQTGDTLRVNGFDLTIVGIYHCGSLLLDVAIIVDMDEVKTMARFDAGSVSSLYIEQDGTVDDETLLSNIRNHFRGRVAETSESWLSKAISATSHPSGNGTIGLFQWLDRWMKSRRPAERANLPEPATEPETPATTQSAAAPRTGRPASRTPGEAPPSADFLKVDESIPIEVRGADSWADRFDKFADDLDIFLSVLTGIGITIAVLSIVNTMLMSVTERIIEFGILKANGWSKYDVLRLITFESGLLGLGGGVLGSLLGWAGTHLINATWPTRVTLFASPGLLAFSVLFSTTLGVLGGLYPAVWAMRMMPMDAIRRG